MQFYAFFLLFFSLSYIIKKDFYVKDMAEYGQMFNRSFAEDNRPYYSREES